MSDDWSGRLLERWRAGDQAAAEELFHRYAERLVALARKRMPPKLSRRLDPEDVVQSVYRSFFAGAEAGRYEVERGGDLWRLLVTITLHKLYHQVERNSADKRNVSREEEGNGLPLAEQLAREPSPVEAAALSDELEKLMQRLDARERRIFELRLQGYELEEISANTQRSLRSVCRVLEEVKHWLEARRGESSSL